MAVASVALGQHGRAPLVCDKEASGDVSYLTSGAKYFASAN